MKTRIFLFIGLLLLGYSNAGGQQAATKADPPPGGTMTVLSSPDLYYLTLKWAGEYNRLNPDIHINVEKVPGGKMNAMLESGAGIGFISTEADPTFNNETVWSMVVGRDVIVPVMNAKNPFIDEINRSGISPEAFTKFFESPENLTWGALLGNGQQVPLHFYMVNDASIKSGVAEFLKANISLNNVATVESGEAMAAIIGKDPGAIGFCRLVSLLDANNALAGNIRLVPIDKNGNGKIDYMEKFYDDMQTFSRGVWIGKYPKALSGKIFAVAADQPSGANETSFLTWVLTDGQMFLDQQGFCDLVSSERQTQLDKLNFMPVTAEPGTYSRSGILALVLVIILAIGVIVLVVDLITRSRRRITAAALHPGSVTRNVFDENSVIVPKGIYFDKTHTWAFMENNGIVKVGIDDFIQHVTGTITRTEMKNPGETVKKGNRLFTMIRNGKQLHIYAPISGTITAQNKALATNASILNTDPYADGWVYMIEPVNWMREIRFLTMAEQYKPWLKEEFSRLKDFFAAALQTHSPEYAPVVLQDGGALQENILADLSPRVWEDFQTNFIDTAR
jgi:glycine cleavage system H lipoate-binding protein/ABC-type phosphate transport system substrate-binding protein